MSIKHGTNRFFPRAEPPSSGGDDVDGLYNCPATVAIGDAVYVVFPNSVDKADASNAAMRPAIGIVESKPTLTTCVVVSFGEVAVFAGLVAGLYYLSDTVPGAMSTTAPSAAGSTVQRVAVAKNATTLVAAFALGDVLLTGP